MRVSTRIFPVAALAALLIAHTASAQNVTGGIQGEVTDENGQPMVLVTVVATSTALQGTQSEFTDSAGHYRIENLPPGLYSLLFIYADSKVKRDNIEVNIGVVTKANAKINTQAAGETIVVHERPPDIDTAHTTQGVNIEQDYLKNIPKRGRTYEGVLGAAAGAQGGDLGISFSGSTELENSYIVDGINTTSLRYGLVASPVLNNFIQEIEVITGGYEAEFGRSTGGVVNVVTKTGSNEFHGSVWANIRPFELDREGIRIIGSALSSRAKLDTDLDFGFDLGGPIVKDKVWFYVGFAPIIGRTKITRIAGTEVDREYNDNDYAARPDPDNNPNTNRNAGCELTRSCEGDGLADEDPATGYPRFEEISRRTLYDSSTAYQFTSKINFAVTPDHQGQISFTGTPETGTSIFSVYGTETAGNEDYTNVVTDLSGKWTSKLNNNNSQIDAVVGWHREKSDGQSVHSTLPQDPMVDTRETPSTTVIYSSSSMARYANLGAVGRNHDVNEDASTLDFCTDNDPLVYDQFPKIANCPVAAYSYNSLGTVIDNEEDRVTGKLTFTQRLKALGHHNIKIGGDFENNTIAKIRNYTGGRGYTAWARYWIVDQFVRPDAAGSDHCFTDKDGDGVDDDVPCFLLDSLPVHVNTFNWAAFAQDSWSILPNLTLNLGLRNEAQIIKYSKEQQDQIDPITGAPIGANAVNLNNLWAPRLGIIYDWTKEGKSKVYAHWGRFYEAVPMNINMRAFGGENFYSAYYDWDGHAIGAQCGAVQTAWGPNDPRLPSNPDNCPRTPSADNQPYYTSLYGGIGDQYGIISGLTLVEPGLKPQYLDELVLGVEYEVLEDLRVGISYQNRRLGRVVEDASFDGADTYILVNPGEFDSDEEAAMEAQINGMDDGLPKQQLQARLDAFRKVRSFDRPSRDYNAFQLTFSKRFSRNFMVQGSYTYSKLMGNYPGLYSPDNSQVDPNISSQYDLIELLANRYGELPYDRPHVMKLDGYYTFDLEKNGRVTVGARLRAQSGVPITPIGGSYYGTDESFILPRGTAGRTDFITNADLHLAYARKIGDMELELYFELFNVFNSQGQASVDQTYTSAYVDPISGGTEKDLPYLVNVDGFGNPEGAYDGSCTQSVCMAEKRQNYGNTAARFAPLSGRFGLTLTF